MAGEPDDEQPKSLDDTSLDDTALDDTAAPPDHGVTLARGHRVVEAPAEKVATLVVMRGAHIGRHFPLRRSRVVLGRGDDADIVLLDKEISRTHAAIEGLRTGGKSIYQLADLESTNHVFVNGVRVERHLLADGDKVQLGDTLLKFELHDALDAKFHSEIRTRIHTDRLTGLLTYESFKTALDWELERYASSAKGCAVVMMDLDDFKKLNDTYGHLAGSYVLSEVGAIIRANLRQFDVGARYGGEEFVAYLPDTEAAEALAAAERLRLRLAEAVFPHQGRSIRLTISMGISHFPEDGKALEALIQVADERLYHAKRTGKNRVVGAVLPAG